MIGQMSIFDWMSSLRAVPDINDITEAEAVRIVGDEIGVTFTYNTFFECWMGRIGKMKLSLEYDHFRLDDNHDLFLGTGYQYGTSGGGAPCSGITEAVNWFNAKLASYNIRRPQ